MASRVIAITRLEIGQGYDTSIQAPFTNIKMDIQRYRAGFNHQMILQASLHISELVINDGLVDLQLCQLKMGSKILAINF